MPRVNNSEAAPCRLQKEIAAQNSYVDTVLTKSETVYKAPCEIDNPKKSARVAEKKS
jgi:hypothetical protein